MQLVGANPRPPVTGLEQLPGQANYFLGNDTEQWRASIPIYAKVKYEGVYPGVDLVYNGNHGQLEYDFVLEAGADPRGITLNFEGADKIEVDSRGDLVLRTGDGEIRLYKPQIYQEVNGTKQPVSGGYVLLGLRTQDVGGRV
jgi:hypothetical protein